MQPKMIHKQFSSGFVHCRQWSNEIKAYKKILFDLSIAKEMFFQQKIQ